MQAVVIGRQYGATMYSPAGSGPQVASNVSDGYGSAASQAQPALITFSWGVLLTAGALLVLYFKVVK